MKDINYSETALNVTLDRQEMFDRSSSGTSQQLPYDYESITHISAYAYSKNGKPTTQPIYAPDVELGTSILPTSLDYLHIKLLYCNGKSTHVSMLWN